MERKRWKLTRFGKLVMKALVDAEMSQRELAARIGTSEQYLAHILYGVRSGKTYVPKIAAVLHLDPERVNKAIAA